MNFAKTLVWINCWLFLAFGFGFILAPESLAALLTGAAPATASAVTDMRATYGGMALGLAVMFGLCASNELQVRLGLQGVLAVMVGLAVARTLGMLLDGTPNVFIFIMLAAEVVMAALALAGLRQAGAQEPSDMPLESTR
ncbi:MAG: DUF4345 domain-containing protein [Aquisalimonadaceae bacterium]